MKRSLLSVALGLATCAATHAQLPGPTPLPVPSTADRIARVRAALPVVEKLYRDYAAQRHIPGLGFGVVVDGQLIFGSGAGVNNLTSKTPATAQSQFRIASMTKSLTAMAILKLRDEGKLRLDDPAANYVPELRGVTPLTTDAPPITVRHLLTHAAGFPEDNPWGDRQLADSEAEFTQFLKGGLSLSNVPGIAYEYANLGFSLLGRIISNVSQQPYQQYITQNILRPLGMNSTIWDYRQADPNRFVTGYRWQEEQWLPEIPLADGSWGAMGGLITTVDDFGKYMALHLSAWPARNDPETGPVKRSSLREMQQPWNFRGLKEAYKYPSGRTVAQTGSYAYGLGWTRDSDGRVNVGHSGGLPGYGSEWQILPDYGIGVVACASLTYASPRGLNTAALDTVITLAGLKPRPVVISAILRQRQAELLRLLPTFNGAETSGIFAENFFPDTPIALRQKALKQVFDKIGRVVRVSEMMPENNLRGTFQIEGERGNLNVFFTLTPEKNALIQQLDLQDVARK